MKKIICFSLLVIFSLPFALAQKTTEKAEIHWSDIYTQKREKLHEFIGMDKDYYYILIEGKKSFYIEKWDMDLKLVKREQLIFKKTNAYLNLEMIYLKDDYIYCFSTSSRIKDSEVRLLFDRYDKKTLLLDGEQKILSSFPFDRHFTNYDAGEYKTVLSPDSSIIMAYFDLPYKNRENKKFILICFDSNLNEIWSRNVEVPYCGGIFNIRDYLVDNQGNIHFLAQLYIDKSNDSENDEGKNHYTIISFYEEGERLIEYPIFIKDKYIKDIKINVDEYNNIICAGFYSNKRLYYNIGSYFLRIDSETKEVAVESYNKFEENFLKQYLSEDEQKEIQKMESNGEEVEMSEYDLDKIIIRKDKSVLLVGQQTSAYYSETGYNSYYYDDIIVISYDNNGDVQWKIKIPKTQWSTNDGGFHSSYLMHLTDDKIFLVYNDEASNLNLKEGEEVNSYDPTLKKTKSHLVLVEIDKSGNIKKELLFNYTEARFYVSPKYCHYINKEQSFIYITHRTNHKYRTRTNHKYGILEFH